MSLDILIGALGAVTGFLSGLLGIGGGIIMAPLLLYAPPLFGFDPLPMRLVAGLTIVQGLAACVSGALAHKKFNYVSGQLTLWMGTTIFLAALAGGAAAKHVADTTLLAVFAALALVAALLISIPTKTDCEAPELATFSFSRLRAVTVSTAVGLLGGLIGQGGSFILIPLMTSFVQIPTRIAIGSNLAIVFISSLAAFLGKAITGQILWRLTLPILITVIPAAHAGGLLSRKISVAWLRFLLAIVIAVAAVRIGVSVIVG